MEIREEFLFTTMQDHKMQMQRFYRKWSQTHPLENGFAHAYVASDGILYAEDDAYAKMALRADRRKPELLFDRGLSEYGGFGNL